MKCKICGKEIPDNSASCKYCGAKLKKTATDARASKKGKTRRTLMTVLLTILTVVLIFAVGVGVVKVVKLLSSSNVSEEINKKAEEIINKKEEPTEEEIKKQEEEKAKAEEEARQAEEAKAEEEKKKAEEEKKKAEEEKKKAEEEKKKAEEEKEKEEKQEEETGPVTPSGKYTLSVDKKETVATIEHYREIEYTINEKLASGVTVKSAEWKSSDTSIVTTEEVNGLCRAWGRKAGEATVTLTVTLSDGQKLTAQTKVTVKDPNAPEEGGEKVTPGPDTASKGSNSYVLADSSTKTYSKAELQKLSNFDLMIARNEIFARHGYIFTNATLKEYFESQSWYSGTVGAADFDYTKLNATEYANINAIAEVESTR